MRLELKKYLNKDFVKHITLYLISGVLTTVVNYFIYFLLTWGFNVNYLVANAIAWIIAVLVAYITNKVWVFKSKSDSAIEYLSEFVKFVIARLSSGITDMVLMFVMVSVMGINQSVSKILVSVIVVVLNYYLSKKFVF